jgi:hypothetical protein
VRFYSWVVQYQHPHHTPNALLVCGGVCVERQATSQHLSTSVAAPTVVAVAVLDPRES